MTTEEPIANALRRWARESAETYDFPAETAITEVDLNNGFESPEEAERDLFEYIADCIDDEQRKIIDSRLDSSQLLRKRASHLGKPFRDGETLCEWLNRWFLPWPVDEKGEPIGFKKKIEDRSGKSEVVSIKYTMTKDGLAYRINEELRHPISERVKLPCVEKFDINGKPIREGDIAYIVPGDHCDIHPLVNFLADEKVEIVETDCRSFPWKGKEGRIYVRKVEDGTKGFPYPSQLTREAPDSLEKLRDDIRANGGATATQWAKRLTAMIEGDDHE